MRTKHYLNIPITGANTLNLNSTNSSHHEIELNKYSYLQCSNPGLPGLPVNYKWELDDDDITFYSKMQQHAIQNIVSHEVNKLTLFINL